MPKARLRRLMIERRAGLPAEERHRFDRLVQENLVATEAYRKARTVALYCAIRGEVETSHVVERSFSLGKRVLLPVVVGQHIVFREFSPDAPLKPGAFGIPEPSSASVVVEPGDAELVVVPGVAFDKEGRRLGYGKGYYDRALHVLEGSGRLYGLCYRFQLIDEIVSETHDVRMDAIITDCGMFLPVGST